MHSKAHVRRETVMHRILAAVDLSDSTQAVLQYSAELARAENARLAVVHAIPAAAPINAVAWNGGVSLMASPEDEQSESVFSLGLLQKVIESAGLANVDCMCERGSAAQTIRDTAQRLHADIIVLGSHGHGRFFHTMFGSVREAVLSHAPCPVLVVPTPAKPS